MSENGFNSPAARPIQDSTPTARVARYGFAAALCGLVFALALGLSGPLAAQPAPATATSSATASDAVPSGAELDSLIQTLDNDQSRAAFVEKLKTLREAQRGIDKTQEPAGPDNWLSRFSNQLRDAVGEIAIMVADINLRGITEWVTNLLADPTTHSAALEGFLKILAILGAGILIHRIVIYGLRHPHLALENRSHDSVLARMPFAILRFAIDFLPLAAGAGTALAVAGFIEPRPVVRLVAIAFINAMVACEVLTMIARLVLAPRTPNLRLSPLGDETAHYLYIWICRLGYIALYGYFALEAALLMGLTKSTYGVLTNMLGLVVALLIVIFILQNRDAVAAVIRGENDADSPWASVRRPLGSVWHLLAIFYVVALYFVLVIRDDGPSYVLRSTALTLVVLILFWAIDGAIRSITRRGFTIAEDVQARFPGLQNRINRYTIAINLALRAFIAVIAGAFILEVWGIEVFAWVASPFGQRVTSSIVSIAIIVALAVVTWELVTSLIERRLTSVTDGRANTRALTLLPLARTALRLVLIILVTMVVLAEIGVNITPLLAGAGVVGLAVGFGAQTLVQDIITGWFILMEDTISVGDVVDLDGHAGLVERINIRTIQLRDIEGSVHTIPFSAVKTVKNMTRDFSYYLFNVGVGYSEDTDRVIEVLRKVDEEMRADSEFGPAILEPLDVLGVDSFGDSAVVIRVRTKTKPVQQWRIGREFNRRIKKAFDAAGIEIPFPHRTIYFGAATDGNAALLAGGGVATPDGETDRDAGEADKNAPRTAD